MKTITKLKLIAVFVVLMVAFAYPWGRLVAVMTQYFEWPYWIGFYVVILPWVGLAAVALIEVIKEDGL